MCTSRLLLSWGSLFLQMCLLVVYIGQVAKQEGNAYNLLSISIISESPFPFSLLHSQPSSFSFRNPQTAIYSPPKTFPLLFAESISAKEIAVSPFQLQEVGLRFFAELTAVLA